MTKIEKRACAFLLAGLVSMSGAASFFADTVHAEEAAVMEQQEEAPAEKEPEVQDVQGEQEEAQPEVLPGEASKDETARQESEEQVQDEPGEGKEAAQEKVKEKVEAEKKASDLEKKEEVVPSKKTQSGQTKEVNDWSYQVVSEENKTAVITGYTGAGGAVSIPGELTVQNDTGEVTYQIVEIGESAFEGNENVTEAVIPKTVTILQYRAFFGCSSLKRVSFETGSMLHTIGEGAFASVKSLESFVCPERLERIGAKAFSRDSALTEVTLNDALETIGEYAFYETGLKSIQIPAKVTMIRDYTFTFCSSLSSVTLGTGIVSIGGEAFCGCESLTEIALPSQLRRIGGGAFSGTGLTKIVIPDSVTTVESGAFSGCGALEDVKIGNGLTYIDKFAFYGSGIKNINFGGKVKVIGDGAFASNRSLTNLVIPSNVTDLQYKTFADCTNLTSITLPDTIEHLTGENFRDTAWYEAQPDGEVYLGKAFYYYKGEMPENTTLKVKPGTRCIAGFSCAQQTNLKSVELPEGLISIGYAAFIETGLKNLYIPASVIQIDDGAVGYMRGKDVCFEYISGIVNAHQVDPDFVISGYPGTEAETYAKENGIKFSAMQWDLSKCSISGIASSYVYTGKTIKPTVTVKSGSFKIPSSNYTVSYKNNIKAGKASVTISGKNALSGQVTRTFVIKPKLTVKTTKYNKIMGAAPFKLNAKAGGAAKLNYSSNNSKVVTVKNGTVSVKGTGKAVVTVSASGNGVKVSKKITITVKPAKMKAPSLKARKKTVTVSWKKASGITGYEIQYSTNKKFTSSTTRTKAIKNASTVKYKISGLKQKTYYVRIRACGRNNLKGSFSNTVRIKVNGR